MPNQNKPTADELALQRLRLAIVETQTAALQSHQALAEAIQLLKLASEIDTPLLRSVDGVPPEPPDR
jgi:hypothetical protein